MVTYTMSKSIFFEKVNKAREKLLKKGLVAIDGSGDSDIEELFHFIALLVDQRLLLVKEP